MDNPQWSSPESQIHQFIVNLRHLLRDLRHLLLSHNRSSPVSNGRSTYFHLFSVWSLKSPCCSSEIIPVAGCGTAAWPVWSPGPHPAHPPRARPHAPPPGRRWVCAGCHWRTPAPKFPKPTEKVPGKRHREKIEDQSLFQEPKLELPTMYKAYVRAKFQEIWYTPQMYSTFILGSWKPPLKGVK